MMKTASDYIYLDFADIDFENFTFNSNDNFKVAFIAATSEKVFLAIQSAIDSILGYEEEISRLANKFDEDVKVQISFLNNANIRYCDDIDELSRHQKYIGKNNFKITKFVTSLE